MGCVGGGWWWWGSVAISAWCVCGLVSGGGAGWGGVGAALLVVGGAGVVAVLDGNVGVLLGRVGVAFAFRAVLAVPGWLRCRGTGGRWLPGHPGGAVVRRPWLAAGGWCLLGLGAGWGAAAGCGVHFVGAGAVGARAWPCGSKGAYCGPNVVSF